MDEKRLASLDEALRFIATANGWREPDTTVTGLVPDETIQSPTERLRATSALLDVELDELPAEARFMSWADVTVEDDDVIVRAQDIDLGTWTSQELRELLHRYRQATGEWPPRRHGEDEPL
jgi:hypothetical protein